MKPIAIFYHTRLSGGDPPIDFEHAFGIMMEQMKALRDSGLADAASKILVGVNGGDFDALAASELLPPRAEMIQHPAHYRGELPTLRLLQDWVRKNKGWNVFYHHTKGAIHKGEFAYDVWRRRMQHGCVTQWRQAVADLEAGHDSVGCHWLTPEQFPHLVSSPFWGGNFWWATSDFIATLPEMPPTATSRPEFYLAESWIGRGPRRPVVRDYYPGWP